MDGRPTWTDCDKAGDYVVPNVLSPSDLVFRPDNMDETVPHLNDTKEGCALSRYFGPIRCQKLKNIFFELFIR